MKLRDDEYRFVVGFPDIYIYYLYVYINTYHIVVTIGRKTAMHLVIFIDSAAACELDRDS